MWQTENKWVVVGSHSWQFYSKKNVSDYHIYTETIELRNYYSSSLDYYQLAPGRRRSVTVSNARCLTYKRRERHMKPRRRLSQQNWPVRGQEHSTQEAVEVSQLRDVTVSCDTDLLSLATVAQFFYSFLLIVNCSSLRLIPGGRSRTCLHNWLNELAS